MLGTIRRDLEEIVATGVTHTATVIVLLNQRGWQNDDILPAIYRALLDGLLDPKGTSTPYRSN
jgi:hypothetical protein